MNLLSKKTGAWAAGIFATAFTAVQPTHAQTFYASDANLPTGNLGSVSIAPASTIALSTAQGITYSSTGNIAVSYFGGAVNIYSPSGQYLSTFANLGSGNGGLTYDSAGDLFISHINTVQKYSSTGTLIGTFASVNAANGLVFDNSGNLYVASSTDHAVYEFDTTGALLQTFSGGDLNGAFGVALTQSGNVLAANFGGTTISEFSPSGSFLGDFATGLDGPAGIASDSQGDIFEVDRNSRTINEFNPSGTLINSYATPSILPTYIAAQATPEPSTLLLGGIAGVALFGLRRGK